MDRSIIGIPIHIGRDGFSIGSKHNGIAFGPCAVKFEDPADPNDIAEVNHQHPAEPVKEGRIGAGILLGLAGAGLLAATVSGLPAIAAVGFAGLAPVLGGGLHLGLQVAGGLCLLGAANNLDSGQQHNMARGALLATGGTACLAAAVLTPITGLAAFLLGLGGLASAAQGISRLTHH